MPPGHPAVYDVLVVLHVVTAVLGFGAVAITGAYGAIARHPDGAGARERGEEVRRYFASPSPVEYLVLVAPVFGVAAMTVRPGGSEFADLWAVAGMVIWVGAGGLLTAVVRPAEGRLRAAAAVATGPPTGPPTGPERRDASRIMWAAAASDFLFVVAVLLMVTQPG